LDIPQQSRGTTSQGSTLNTFWINSIYLEYGCFVSYVWVIDCRLSNLDSRPQLKSLGAWQKKRRKAK